MDYWPYQYLPATPAEAAIYCPKAKRVDYTITAAMKISRWDLYNFKLERDNILLLSDYHAISATATQGKSTTSLAYNEKTKAFESSTLRLTPATQRIERIRHHNATQRPTPPEVLRSWKTTYLCQKDRTGRLLVTKESEATLAKPGNDTNQDILINVLSISSFAIGRLLNN
mgnify:CR=1 FL=1